MTSRQKQGKLRQDAPPALGCRNPAGLQHLQAACRRARFLPALLAILLLPSTPVLRAADPPTTQPATKPATQPATAPAGHHGRGHGAAQPDPLTITLSPVVQRLLADPTTTAQQKRRLAIFHGQWDKVDQPTIIEQAQIALDRFDLDNPALRDPAVPALLRAQAALHQGDLQQAAALLPDPDSAQAALVRAQALDLLGRTGEAVALLEPWRARLQQQKVNSAAELTAAARILILLARLQGRPAQDYHLAMSLLGKAHEQLDQLYYPAEIAEATILAEKDSPEQALDALLSALTLNPQSSWARYQLGELFIRAFDIAKTSRCIDDLRKIHSPHLLADVLEIRLHLQQKDPRSAQAIVDQALARYPQQRDLLALQAATLAMSFQEEPLQRALAQFQQLSPGNPLALCTVGRYLSLARQYESGAAILRQAVALRPNDPAAQVELGLLLMQQGDEDAALTVLRAAVALDPFNLRAANQLRLVEELATYQQIRTDHFIIKFKPGIDEVVARDMPEELERIYRDVTTRFGYQPERPTLIEIMPDEQWFGVRITGMPDIWTIAASTGDVISLVPPREGARQRGPFDWARVIRHEFTHTVTLGQTRCRIPHWFTEACAVSEEPGGRDFSTCALLASALLKKRLFPLDKLNLGFIRPQTEMDRPLAYAQSHWMLEYITAAYGHDALIRMLALYREGAGEVQGLEQAIGVSAPRFMEGFLQWAHEQVVSWGLIPPPDDAQLRAVLRSSAPPQPQTLQELLRRFPDQPDLLQLWAKHLLEQKPLNVTQARQALLRYAAARPVDDWSVSALIRLDANDPARARERIASLEQLDSKEVSVGTYSQLLAQAYRQQGQLEQAQAAITRALQREPFNADFREFSATIALQQQDLPAALQQLQNLAVLEPTRSIHQVRLAAIYSRLERPADARAAAHAARKLDPAAPVDAFLR